MKRNNRRSSVEKASIYAGVFFVIFLIVCIAIVAANSSLITPEAKTGSVVFGIVGLVMLALASIRKTPSAVKYALVIGGIGMVIAFLMIAVFS